MAGLRPARPLARLSSSSRGATGGSAAPRIATVRRSRAVTERRFMTDQEALSTADLLTKARTALETFHDVHVDDDGALTFRHVDVPCAVQAMQLADGLTVLSLTCVVAWDLPDDPKLASSAAERAGQGLFGTLGVVHTDRGMDVTLRYAFPGRRARRRRARHAADAGRVDGVAAAGRADLARSGESGRGVTVTEEAPPRRTARHVARSPVRAAGARARRAELARRPPSTSPRSRPARRCSSRCACRRCRSS